MQTEHRDCSPNVVTRVCRFGCATKPAPCRALEAVQQAQAEKQAADAQLDALQSELMAARADQQRLAEVEGAFPPPPVCAFTPQAVTPCESLTSDGRTLQRHLCAPALRMMHARMRGRAGSPMHTCCMAAYGRKCAWLCGQVWLTRR